MGPTGARRARRCYERLCLEGFQSGLSWLTILRKRENFRAAFAGFDPRRRRRFGERDVERLLGDAGIVRHRGKIEAAIANARATVELRESGTPLHELVWQYRRRRPADDASGSRRRPSRWSCRSACERPASASSARRRSTRRCRRAASSTTTAPTAGCATRSSGNAAGLTCPRDGSTDGQRRHRRGIAGCRYLVFRRARPRARRASDDRRRLGRARYRTAGHARRGRHDAHAGRPQPLESRDFSRRLRSPITATLR